MIVVKKTDDKNVYLKLSLCTEDSLFQDGFMKSETVLELPKINNPTTPTTFGYQMKLDSAAARHPAQNATIIRIFNAISKGNCDEVDFSLHFVSFNDSYFQNQTAAIACLFCDNYLKRRAMLKTLMKWKMNFKLPDLVFERDSIHWCCILNYKCEFEMIIDYLDFDIDYQRTDIDSNTYLHLAVMSNSLAIVKILLTKMTENKIKVDLSNLLGFTAYILSRKLGYRDISNYFESISDTSKYVCDNLLHKSPREWSILGKISGNDNKKKFKQGQLNKLTTFKIPELDIENVPNKKVINLNNIIHSAYILWTGQHVQSFRKLAVERDVKMKKSYVIPPIQTTSKKSKVK